MLKCRLEKHEGSDILCVDEPMKSTIIICLPHGSGIDSDWKLSDKENIKSNQIRITNSFHLMDEGTYVGWIGFEVIYTLEYKDCLNFSLNMDVTLNEDDIKAIADTYDNPDDFHGLIADLDYDIYQRLEIAEE